MTPKNLSCWSNLRYDFPSSIVVVLVALPLCLGIALASGAPLVSGLIAGVLGGVIVGAISKSPLSVSGPAAGLTVIVLSAIQELPTLNAFFLAVFLAGIFQIVFGLLRAGIVGDFIPTSVIKGMLAAIGLILILKQLPHAVGYNKAFFGEHAFKDHTGENTFSALFHMLDHGVSMTAIFISLISLVFLFWWDKVQSKAQNFIRYVPGPLIVVGFGLAVNVFVNGFLPDQALTASQLVAVPVISSFDEFTSLFAFPDFAQLSNPAVWTVAITLALVASVETLLSIEAVDKLDPFKRVTPTNRELFAQGVGNSVCGLVGGLPVTSVIVRSSANVSSGARTKASAILHGVLLFALVLAIPKLLNLVPLSALAAVLIAVGYKLTKPSIFMEKYERGMSYFVPFVATISAILLTDLLVGIGIGIVVSVLFMVFEGAKLSVTLVEDEGRHLIRFRKDLFFLAKPQLKKLLNGLPDGANVLIDMSQINYIDLDNMDIFHDFMLSLEQRGITVKFKDDMHKFHRAFA
ncbi:MAG: SulP family inorganic anion transporter [Pseudobdellovibrionaceae bacterium]